MTTNQMQVPEWAEGQRDTMLDMLSTKVSLDPKELDINSEYSTHFAEWDLREDDLILHVFPRNGGADLYSPGKYVPICRNCKAEMPMPKSLQELNACPKCGKTGLLYIPGRLEEKHDVAFPANILEKLQEAADKMWMGDIAIELVPELGAYVLQFQGARATAENMEVETFVDRFCEALDTLLEGK
jgi:hypothetical protein